MGSAFAGLQAQITALNAQLDGMIDRSKAVDASGYQRMTKAAAANSATFRNAAASTGMFEVQQLRLNKATEDYVSNLQKQKLSFRDLAKQSKVASAAYKQQLAMQQMIVRQNVGSNVHGRQTLDVLYPKNATKDLDTLGNKIGWIREQTRSAATQMVNWGKNTQWAGRQLMVGFTMPLVAFGAAAGVLAYQLDKEFTRIKKVYNTTADQTSTDLIEMGRVSAEFANLQTSAWNTAENAAKQYGSAAKDTMSVQAELAATGQRGAMLQSSTNEVMKNAMLGEIDYNTATSTTIALQQQLHLSTAELTDAWAYMNSVENSTSLQMKDFAAAIPIALGPMKQMGATLQDLGTLMTGMVSRGIQVGKAANAIKALPQRLMRPSQQIQEEWKSITGTDIIEIADRNKGHIMGMLNDIYEATRKLSSHDQSKAFAGLFGSFQLTTMSSMIESMGDLEKGIGQVSTAQRVGAQDAEKWRQVQEQEISAYQNSVAGKFKKALETIKIQIAKVGEPFIVVATKVINGVTAIIEAFNKLPSIAKYVIAGAAVFAALVGPIVMLIGLFANFTGNMLKFGVSITRVLGSMNILTEQAAAMQIANKFAEKGFITETTAIQQQTAALNLLTESMIAAKAVKTGGVAPLGAPRTSVGQPVISPYIPNSQRVAPMPLDPKTGQVAGETARAWKTAAGSIAMAGAGLALMKGDSEGLVHDFGVMVMYAAILGPALAAIPFKAIGTGLASAAGKTALAAGGIKNMGKAIPSILFNFGKFAGPAGLIAAAIGGMVVLHGHIDDNAEALAKLNDTGEKWAEIYGYTATKPGAMIDPKTGEQVDSFTEKVNKLNEAAPEIGESVRKAYETAGGSAVAAAKQIDAVNIAIRQGLNVIQSGGDSTQAREAAKATLTAGVEDATKVKELMKQVDLQIDFKLNKDVMDASLDQVAQQINDAVTDRIGRTASENTWTFLFGDDDGISEGSREAGRNAAADFYASFSTANKKEQVTMAKQIQKQFDDMMTSAFSQLKASPEALAALSQYGKEITAASSNFDISGALINLSMDSEGIKRLEEAGFDYETIKENVDGIAHRNKEFTQDLAKQAGFTEDTANGMLKIDDFLKKIVVGFLTIEEAQKAFREGLLKTQTIGPLLPGAEKTRQTQSLVLLNQLRINAGLEKTGTLADMFNEKVTKKWTPALNRAKSEVDKVNRTLRSTMSLIGAISNQSIIDAARGAMTDFQQGIADATMSKFTKNMDAHMANVQANGQKRLDAFDRHAENAQNHLENMQERRRERVEAGYDSRINKIKKAIEAEEKADDIRQRIFEAELKRIERLNDAANTNIDFNVALNTGNLDEAAKIANDIQAKSDQWTLEDAGQKASVKTEKRIEMLQNRMDLIEKAKQKELDALQRVEDREKQSQQRRLENERKFLQAQVEANQRAEQAKYDARSEFLEQSLDDFTGITATSTKELQKQVAEWNKSHKGLTLETEGRWNTSSDNVSAYIKESMGKARDKIVNDAKWESSGKKIAADMIWGAFHLNMADFKRWMVTGKYPEKSGPRGGGAADGTRPENTGFGPTYHSGGMIDGGSGSGRAGVAKNYRGIHSSEQMILAQKGEYVVNKNAASKHVGLLEQINSGGISSNSRMNTGDGIGGGVTGAALGFGGIMMGAIGAALKSSLSNAVTTGGIQGMKNERKLNASKANFASGNAGLYGDRFFSTEQLQNAATIANVGKKIAGISNRDIEIGIMTAITESGLVNIHGGDRDSQGLFQQRPSMGWGTVEQVTNPKYAAAAFFNALRGVADRDSMSPWVAAQTVQRSAFSDGSNYKQYWDEGQAIFSGLARSTAGVGSGYAAGSGGWHKPSIPGKGWSNSHDYRNGLMSPLFAASDGTVVDSRAITSGGSPGNGKYSTPYRSYGETIAIRTSSGDLLRYAHLSPGQRFVRAGQHVKGGALIGRSGMTGNATGPHTHFDVNGDYNAKGWMDAHGISLRKGAENIRWDNTIANLHKGESVLTEDISTKFRQGVDNFANGGGTEYNLTMHFGDTNNKEEIAQYVMQTIKRAENRKPRGRRG